LPGQVPRREPAFNRRVSLGERTFSFGEHVMVTRVERPTPPNDHWLTKTAFVLMITGLVAVEVVLRTGILAVPDSWPH
jgi:hypothetical protein